MLRKRCYTKTTINSHAPIWNAYAIVITDLDGVTTMDTLDAIVGFVDSQLILKNVMDFTAHYLIAYENLLENTTGIHTFRGLTYLT